MNWDDLRYFLAIARTRSLTTAGKELGVSQPTVSRRLAAMEEGLGVRLFDRTRRGYELSAPGADIFEPASRVEEELNGIERKVRGQDLRLTGSLRITCTEVLLSHYLARPIGRFLAAHPGIDLSVICTFAHLSLNRREADVAIRFTSRPPETLVGRRLAKTAFGVYGAANGDGRPDGEDPEAWHWIGWQDETYNRMLIGGPFPDARIKHRVDSLETMGALAKSGLGAAVLPCYLADPDPALRRIVPEPLREESPDLWILSHPDLRRVARVRRFSDFVTDTIAADRDLFEGRRA